MKKTLFTIFVLSLFGCVTEPGLYENESRGYAQGSTYQVKYICKEKLDLTPAFDSIFRVIDQSMSTYRDESLIAIINQGDTMVEVDDLFMTVLNRSIEVSRETNGLFDPTVGPLVELWGFGKSKDIFVDSIKVDSALALVGFEKIIIDGSRVGIPAGFRIDFNSIAQGYTVDVIASYLERKNIKRYMVEVGGELRVKGKNISKKYWRIGVDKPMDEIDLEDRFQLIMELENKALATSGNYRKFWIDKETGVKYAHTIDPKSGFPAKNQLLSVTIISNDCIDADAYATACMVMGLQDAMKFVSEKDGMEAYFISTDENGDWEVSNTKGFNEYIVN